MEAGRALSELDCVKKQEPTRTECLAQYPIGIRFLSLGCVISVGCKEIPFSTIGEGMKALNEYVADPIEGRKIWEDRFFHQ